MKTCWECKHFIRTGGHETSDWGYCARKRSSVVSSDKCEMFEEEKPKITPVKIEIVKKKAEVDETKYYFMVYIYDNKGELIHAKWFNAENLAGSYAFEMEQYYKFLKED